MRVYLLICHVENTRARCESLRRIYRTYTHKWSWQHAWCINYRLVCLISYGNRFVLTWCEHIKHWKKEKSLTSISLSMDAIMEQLKCDNSNMIHVSIEILHKLGHERRRKAYTRNMNTNANILNVKLDERRDDSARSARIMIVRFQRTRFFNNKFVKCTDFTFQWIYIYINFWHFSLFFFSLSERNSFQMDRLYHIGWCDTVYYSSWNIYMRVCTCVHAFIQSVKSNGAHISSPISNVTIKWMSSFQPKRPWQNTRNAHTRATE